MTIDLDLKSEDIQSLASRDAVVQFFAALGYNTETRIAQSAANLGIGTESVVREIKHIEQIASQDGLLHVFLFELASVTVVLTNALVRSFRNKQGEYLLVLTNDYERIDFVLVERSIPLTEAATSIGEKHVSVKPRVLTVERRKPTRRQLRVLRRFTYTESDPYYQYDKLKSAYSIYDWSEEHFNNRILFADYYLQERLRDQPEWKEDVRPSYLKIHEVMADAAHLWNGRSESELRIGLFEKLFVILGFTFKKVKDSKDDSPRPDYLLYGKSGNTPTALCLCYPWGRSLDGKDDQRDQDTPEENPSAAVVSALKDGKTPWAIVTNGKLWRLFNAKTSSIAASYYEIDLEEILAAPSQLASPSTFDLSESFKYFLFFFRSDAFEPSKESSVGEEKTTTFLDLLLKGSEEYAKRLGERLKDRVFEEVFIHFAEGFVDFVKKRDRKDVDLSQEKLDEIFQGTLTLLYRFLFLLYAESRDLFPVKEVRGYFQKSLTRLKQEIAEAGGQIEEEVENKLTKQYSPTSTVLYDRLLELFGIVDQGDASINVPMYNGGLFLSKPSPEDDSEDAKLARFLLSAKVPDRQLALGLDLLARDEDDKTFKSVPIDYKSLGVRQLGSIYEGLLEFKLRIADVKMAVVKGKKTEEVVPYDQAVKEKLKILKGRINGAKSERIIPKGTLYLENDKRERKATGSYYTPDYIVKYIVENTVGPVLKEKCDSLAPEFRKAQQAYREAVKRKEAFIAQKMKPTDPELVVTRGEFVKLVHDLFDIKVLDAAMGSGHFLVEAADFISDRLIDFLNGFPWNPVMKMLKDTRSSILVEMEKQGVNIDSNRLTDVNLIKRHVLKRAIYGVDINPMAVELAKVSLWLNCFTLGAPLSFLDHHLKCGNSLVGASIDDVRNELEKDLFGGQFAGLLQATEAMIHVGELSDVTADQVKESQRSFMDASHILGPFKEVLDLWVSQYFGNEDVRQLFRTSQFPQINAHWEKQVLKLRVNKAIDSGSGTKKTGTYIETIDVARLLSNARNSATGKRFFHWELEFPEVFFDKGKKKDIGGFDAVIGNPPYVRVQLLGYAETDYFKCNYRAAFRRVDVATLFLEKSIVLSRGEGLSGLILSSQFMTGEYGQKLRSFLLDTSTPTIIDFKDLPVFEDALTYVAIFLVCNQKSAIIRYLDIFSLELKQRQDKIQFVLAEAEPKTYSKISLGGDPWLFNSESDSGIFNRISRCSQNLGQIGEARTGLFTGLDEVLMIYPEQEKALKLESGVLLPIVSGTEPDRYYLNSATKKVIYPYREVDGETVLISEEEFKTNYPNVYNYLKKSKTRLESRRDSRKEFSENKSWYQLTRFGTLSLFKKPKILTPGEVQRNSFCLDDAGYAFSVARVFAVDSSSTDLCYLLALLNSKLVEFQLRKIAPPKQGGYSAYSSAFLERSSIRSIHFSTMEKKRKELVDRGTKMYRDQEGSLQSDFSSLLEFVKELLPKDTEGNFLAFGERATGAEEQSDVVHDLLAYLAEEMIRLNKEKHAEMKHFLGWLEKELRIIPSKEGIKGLQVLSGRTHLLNYLGDYQKQENPLSYDELEDILFKNKSRLGISTSNPTFASKLRVEFEHSLETLLPIRSTLERTDNLIDQIVYRLYGLTEEEIRIVEGKDHH